MSSKNTSGSFFYTLLGYVVIVMILALITLIVGLSMYWSGFLRLMVSVSRDTAVKWIGFIVYTPVTFGLVVRVSRQRWHNKVFWWTMTGILVIHLATFWVVLINVEHSRMAWLFVICTLEVIPITAVLDWTTDRFARAYGSHGIASSHRK